MNTGKLPDRLREGFVQSFDEKSGRGKIKLIGKSDRRNGEIGFSINKRCSLIFNGTLHLEKESVSNQSEEQEVKKGVPIICLVGKEGGKSVACMWATKPDNMEAIENWHEKKVGTKAKKREHREIIEARIKPVTATLTQVNLQTPYCYAELPCGKRVCLPFKRFHETVRVENGTTSFQIGDKASGRRPSIRRGQDVILVLPDKQSKREHPMVAKWALAEIDPRELKPSYRNKDVSFRCKQKKT